MYKFKVFKRLITLGLVLAASGSLTCMSFARDIYPDEVVLTLKPGADVYIVEVADYDSDTDSVLYKIEDTPKAATKINDTTFEIPKESESFIYQVSGQRDYEYTVPEIKMSIPGESGYLYNPDQIATLTGYTYSDKRPAYGVYKMYDSVTRTAMETSGDTHTVQVDIYNNGTYGVGFCFDEYDTETEEWTDTETGEQHVNEIIKNYMKAIFIKEAEIACYDLEEPEISWERIDADWATKDETDINPGVRTKIRFNPTDDTGIVDLSVTNNLTTQTISLENPYEYEINQNQQLTVEAKDKAGNITRIVVTVNWYKTTAETPPVDIADPDNSSSSTAPDNEDEDKDNSSNSSSSSSSNDKNNSNNVKLYNTQTTSSSKANSSWDKYWVALDISDDSSSGSSTVSAASTVKPNSNAVKNKTASTTKSPVTPTGYTYVYRSEDTRASSEEIEREINSIITKMQTSGEEVKAEDLAITSEVTLVPIQEQEEQQQINFLEIGLKIFLFTSLAFVIGVFLYIGYKTFNN